MPRKRKPEQLNNTDSYMEIVAMQDKETIHTSDLKEPKSCREKFLQAWREKQKLQSLPALPPQESKCQPAVENPIQDDMSSSHVLTRASLQRSENAVYLLMLKLGSLGQSQSDPTRSWLTGLGSSQELPVVSWQQKMTNVPLDTEDEFYQICVSDLLMNCSVKKRPRLLPPDTKMHVEVRKRQKCCPLQEGQVSPPAENLSPPEDKEAPNYQATIRKPVKLRFKEHQMLSENRNPSASEMVQQPVKLPKNKQLPPKKQYIQAWREETHSNMASAL